MDKDALKGFVIRRALLGEDAHEPDRHAMELNHGHGVFKERLI